MTGIFSLGKAERLKSQKLIAEIFSSGKKFNLPLFRVHYLHHHSEKGLQVGVTVSSRYFKKAVDRNRVKRLMREAWRLQKTELQSSLKAGDALAVFIIYTGRELPAFEVTKEKIKSVMDKLLEATSRKQ